MSDAEKPSVQGSRQGAASGTIPREPWWRRAWDAVPLQALRAQARRIQSSLAAHSTHKAFWLFRSGTWMVIVWILLICLPIGGVILGYIRRPAPGTASINAGTSPLETSSGEKIPKPPAGRPKLPESQAPPPTISSPTPAPISPEAPPPITPPASPLSPKSATTAPPPPASIPATPAAPGSKPVFAAVTYPARHDRHFGEQCSGQLTLNSSGLFFTCPGNSGDGIDVAVNQIDGADDNGIRLFSGKKYHFTIQGMSKSGERQLFSDWLNRVR